MLSELRFPIEKLIGQFEILNLESKFLIAAVSRRRPPAICTPATP
jgi:hypothetical protein